MDANEYKELVKDAVANIGAYCNAFEDCTDGCIFYNQTLEICRLQDESIWNWEDMLFDE